MYLDVYCRLGEFQCLDGQQCIPERFRCNGIVDCADFSHERECDPPKKELNLRTYPTEQTIEEGKIFKKMFSNQLIYSIFCSYRKGGCVPVPR